MLEEAKKKGVYQKLIQDFLGPNRLPLEDGKWFSWFPIFADGNKSSCYDNLSEIMCRLRNSNDQINERRPLKRKLWQPSRHSGCDRQLSWQFRLPPSSVCHDDKISFSVINLLLDKVWGFGGIMNYIREQFCILKPDLATQKNHAFILNLIVREKLIHDKSSFKATPYL